MVLVYSQLIILLFKNIFLFLFHINKLCLIKGYVISLVNYITAYILYKLLYKNAATFPVMLIVKINPHGVLGVSNSLDICYVFVLGAFKLLCGS